MKNFIKKIEANPSKRIYYSIIADYVLNKSICELVDNAIDLWVKNGKNALAIIKIELDIDQQRILIEDNVGGIKEGELKKIVAPGYTSNDINDDTIGFFGVGSKRAVVALSQDIVITTRFKNEKTTTFFFFTIRFFLFFTSKCHLSI